MTLNAQGAALLYALQQIVFFPVYFLVSKKLAQYLNTKESHNERNEIVSLFLFIPKSIVLMVCTCHVNLLYCYMTLFFCKSSTCRLM